jgi:hypothetical protein
MNKKMMKPWVNGPFKTIHEFYPPINYEPGIDKPVKKVLPMNNNIINNHIKQNNSLIKNKPSWREANAMSHALFLWNDRNSKII